MLRPATLNLRADRHVPFVRTLGFIGYDFTGYDFRMEIRVLPDAPGDPLIQLLTVTSNVEGVWLFYTGTATLKEHIEAGRIPSGVLCKVINPNTGFLYQNRDIVLLSVLSIRIEKADVVNLPASCDNYGSAWFGAWDIHLTPPAGDEDKWAGGMFIVEPGATF